MRESAYVGRVGGLAVALGIGIAFGGVGVAAASPSDSSTSPGATDKAPARSDAVKSLSGRKLAPKSVVAVTRRGDGALADGLTRDVSNSYVNPAAVVSAPHSSARSGDREHSRRELGRRDAALLRSNSRTNTPALAAAAVEIPLPEFNVLPIQRPVGRLMVSETVKQLVASSQALTVAIKPASATGGIGGIFQAFFNAIAGFLSQILAVFGIRTSATNTPPVATAPTVSSPDPTTGLVTGKINVTDSDGDPLTFSSDGATLKGDIKLTDAGAFSYTPTTTARQNAGKAGATDADKTDSFTVTIFDSWGATATVTVGVQISPATNTNQPPTIGGYSVGNPSTTGAVVGRVIASDANGDPLNYSFPATTAKGAIARNLLDLDGTFIYTPTSDALSAATAPTATSADKFDTFIATVSDGRGGVATVAVTVPVGRAVNSTNSPPIAGTPMIGTPDSTTGVVAGRINVTDPDGNTLKFSTTSPPAKGTVIVNATNGAFSFTPTAAARQNAGVSTASPTAKTDSFTVTVSDGNGGSVAVPVTVPISPTNSPPAAGTTSIGAADPTTGLIQGKINATDPNADTLTYFGTGSTSKGSVIVNAASGAFSYTPTVAARQNAAAPTATTADMTDSFTVTVSDGNGGSTSVPVTVPISPTALVLHNTVIATVKVGGTPYKVAVSPDGTRAYVTNMGSGTVSVIDTARNTVTATIGVGGYPLGIAISPDGATAYVTDNPGTTVSVIRTSDNTVTGSITVGAYPYGAVVSADGKTAYFASDASVSKIDTATRNGVQYNLGGALYDIAVSPSGKTFYVADVYNNQVVAVNTVTNTSVRIPVSQNPYGMAMSPDGTRIYVVSQFDDTVSVISTLSNRVGAIINVGRGPWGVAVSPDGKIVYVVNQVDNTVSVIRTADNAVTAVIPVGSHPQSVAFSPDGQRAYVTNRWDFTVSVISV